MRVTAFYNGFSPWPIKSNQVVMIAIPCQSFSVAVSRGEIAIRNKNEPKGVKLDALTANQQKSINSGNRVARATCKLLEICCLHNVPAVMENPQASILWHWPELQPLINEGTSCVVSHCAFGARRRKNTRLLFMPAIERVS